MVQINDYAVNKKNGEVIYIYGVTSNEGVSTYHGFNAKTNQPVIIVDHFFLKNFIYKIGGDLDVKF